VWKSFLQPDASHQRLQPIKDIMNAAGVERISDLSTLQFKVPTVMTPGKVLMAPRKVSVAVDWGAIAAKFKIANLDTCRSILAEHLTNRNSAETLKAMGAATPKPVVIPSGTVAPVPVLPSTPPLANGGRVIGLGNEIHTGPRLPRTVLSHSPTIRLSQLSHRVADLFTRSATGIKVVDKTILQQLEAANPVMWPSTNDQGTQLLILNTIPVNSSVIIAGTLDLTDTELIIEPTVSTLYIIAEKVICGPNAKITWRKPGGSTPARADDDDLNGRAYHGVQTKPNSRDGLDGEDGRPGGPGIEGFDGLQAPNLEMWVMNMTGLPNLDLTGETGIVGGRGQRGGHGGRGGDGHVGRRYWLFGWHCSTDPGDGGDGGDGGHGGAGGRGGDGGNGGRITIGVLENTLAATVMNQPIKLKNSGAAPGQGGMGGPGGSGGAGGWSGVGETCHDANNGHPGAQGQPGAAGAQGAHTGNDGYLEFFEFTQDAWEDMLTRPWLTDVSPAYAFPGDVLTLRGSRFSSNDRVYIDSTSLAPTINADESISVTLPLNTTGGEKAVYIRRQDGTESNRDRLFVKPRLDELGVTQLIPGSSVTLNGQAFLAGASVLVDGSATPANVTNPRTLTFTMPGTGGGGTSGGSVTVQVHNPDGLVSNTRSADIPHILEVPFKFSQHALSFPNFSDGVPDWGTYEDTFGAAEVWHEQLDPIFGHPLLTAAFYFFYEHFLKGTDNGGLATAFCTSLASLVADRFWQGYTDAPTLTKAAYHKYLTAVHGKLLSRESLITFHDQSQSGVARVEATYREIEKIFLSGCDRYNMPLLFFIPSGAIWDEGYIDQLGDAHCVMPYRFIYPTGRSPQLSGDGSTTITDPDQVQLFVWDCNHPASQDCRLVFRRSGGQIHFDYFVGSTASDNSSSNGVTLGMMTLGNYLLSDHDLPFSGPFGLTSFIIDFLLSPADLQVTDANGLRTGNFAGQIYAEIANSHPCYLMKGAYLLPTDTALTRRIVGRAAGAYKYYSIMPDGASLSIEGVSTAAGQEDLLAINGDASQIRITPSVNKVFSITLTRQVEDQVRALAIQNIGGGPTADIDLTVSPELNLLRLGNRGIARTVEVRAFAIDRATNTPINKKLTNIPLPTNHDLIVAISDWATVDLSAQTLSFE
jgi:hypothetical protein